MKEGIVNDVFEEAMVVAISSTVSDLERRHLGLAYRLAARASLCAQPNSSRCH